MLHCECAQPVNARHLHLCAGGFIHYIRASKIQPFPAGSSSGERCCHAERLVLSDCQNLRWCGYVCTSPPLPEKKKKVYTLRCVQLSEGGFQVVYPFGEMGPFQSEVSRSLRIRQVNLAFTLHLTSPPLPRSMSLSRSGDVEVIAPCAICWNC